MNVCPQIALVFRAYLCSALVAGIALAGIASAEEAFLRWTNGDRLNGRLIAAESDRVAWGSALFTDPLMISVSALAEITFPQADPGGIEDQDLFRVCLRNGDVLTGTLVSIGLDTIELLRAGSGRVRLRREAVRRLVRVAGRGCVFEGPRGLAGWRHPVLNSWESPPGWQAESDGRLTTSRPDAVMFHPLAFPEPCEIEVVLSSSRVPAFVMALGSNPEASLRLETRDNLLVCRNGRDTVIAGRLRDDQRRIHLHLFLDSVRHLLQVDSESGQLLAVIARDENAAIDPGNRPVTPGRQELPSGTSSPGLLFRNGAADLTVEYLAVTPWYGPEHPGVTSDVSRIPLMDGTVRLAQVTGISPDRRSLLVREGDAVGEIRLPDVRELHFAESPRERHTTDPPETTAPSPGLVRCHWEDGSVISGRLQSIQDGDISLVTDSMDSALRSSLDGITALRFVASPHSADESVTHESAGADRPDRLIHRQGSLRGSLVMDSDPVMSVRWRPEGGLTAAGVRVSRDTRFVRGNPVPEVTSDLAEFPDVIYTTDGDVLPCHIEDCSGDSVTMASPFSERRSLSASQVRAVELSCTGRPGQAGFGDSRWKSVIGDVERTDDMLTFRASEAIWHPDILTGEAIRFRLGWDAAVTATISLQLFTSQAGNFQKGIGVSLQCRGQQISVQKQSVDPRRMPFSGNERESGLSLTLQDSVADVRITTSHGRLRVSIDEQRVGDFEFSPADTDQRGLLMRANVINWSSDRRPAVGAGERGEPAGVGAQASQSGSIRISEFSVGTVVGASVKQFVDEESRLRTLMIPRFRRSQPPTHVLLGPNGDLLRGRLISLNDETVEFESRLERIALERSRVASIVWLRSANDRVPVQDGRRAEERAAPSAEGAADPMVVTGESPGLRIVIGGGYLLTMKTQGLQDGVLRGSSAILGDCRIPLDWIGELQSADAPESDAVGGYTEWVSQMTPDPQWEESDGAAVDGSAAELTGTIAADFELPLPVSGTLRMSDYSDRIIVLDFWASWCGPCRATMPEFVEVVSKFDHDKVALIGVNLEETPQEVRDFLGRQQLTFTSALDHDRTVARRFRVSGIPHTVVLAPGLVIESVVVGHRRDRADDLRRTIQSLLDGTWHRPEKAGPEKAGPEKAGPEKAGPENAGPEKAGPETPDSSDANR